MNKQQKEDFDRIKKDFYKLKDNKTFDVDDEERLVFGIQGLLGIFAVEKSEELEAIIEEMISFGEAHDWSMAGSKFLFEKIKK